MHQIIIPQKYQFVYGIGRFVLYGFFLFLTTVLFLKVVFPDIYGTFEFSRYDDPKNSLLEPREIGELKSDGGIQKGEFINFGAIAEGDFKSIHAGFTSSKDQELKGEISFVRKYRAMTYPDGLPAIFFDGTLLSLEDKFFIVSEGKTRYIPKDIFDILGFSKEQFLPIGENEFSFQTRGDDIRKDEYWIQGSLFHRDGMYYQIKENRIDFFVSERAYLSKYKKEYARNMNRDFPDEGVSKVLGFANGTLMDYQGGVYVSSEGKARPIDSPQSFLSKGYSWEDVIKITEEEFLAYEQGEIYNARRTHIDGTVFIDTVSGETFFIESEKKRLIRGENILKQYENIPPVIIEAHPESISCILKEDSIFSGYGCSSSLLNVDGRGVEYQLRLMAYENMDLSEMNITFDKEVNGENFRKFLAELRIRILKRFGL
ncbi:MAG: hypothetical protein IPN70_05010 [Candidatus Moraniibacteriota bacterium]|nr:MAG: hypothetical protein IPN70_05010 [Candidatus Moranbacteria bacterium]